MISKSLLNQKGRINLVLTLAIFFGVGTALFGGLSIYFYSVKIEAVTDRDGQVNKAVSIATAKQKKDDEIAAIKAAEAPYRTYTAETVFGGFSVDIPKSWNLYAEKNLTGAVQLMLVTGPDVVTIDKNANRLQPTKVILSKDSATKALEEYQERLKKKKLTASTVTVSGIQATQVTGLLDDKQTQPTTIIIVPVRDKSIQFTNDDRNYTEQFKKIVESAKITP